MGLFFSYLPALAAAGEVLLGEGWLPGVAAHDGNAVVTWRVNGFNDQQQLRAYRTVLRTNGDRGDSGMWTPEITVCGYVVARLAPWHLRHHVVIATIVMLLIGVFVQRTFWDAVPVWHHFVFFACIVGGMHLGGYLRARRLGTRFGGE